MLCLFSIALLSENATNLAGAKTLRILVLGFGDLLNRLAQVDLNVAGVRVETVNTAVSTVSTTTTLGGLVDLNVLDNKVLSVQTLGISVGTSVLKKVSDELDALDRPTGLGNAELFTLGSATNVTVVLSEGDSTLLLSNGFEIFKSGVKLLAGNSLGSSLGILKAHAEVGSTRGGNSSRCFGGLAVSSHLFLGSVCLTLVDGEYSQP